MDISLEKVQQRQKSATTNTTTTFLPPPITPDYVTTNAAYCLSRCAAEYFVVL